MKMPMSLESSPGRAVSPRLVLFALAVVWLPMTWLGTVSHVVPVRLPAGDPVRAPAADALV